MAKKKKETVWIIEHVFSFIYPKEVEVIEKGCGYVRYEEEMNLFPHTLERTIEESETYKTKTECENAIRDNKIEDLSSRIENLEKRRWWKFND